LIALVIGLKCIEQKTPTTEAHLNVIQLLCIVIGFVSLIFALQKGGAAITAIASGDSSAMGNMILAVVLLVVGVLALVVFGLLSRRAFSPLIRLGVLRSVSFRWHLFSYMLFPFVTIGLGFVMPNLLQLGLGCTPLIAGLSLLPAAFLGAIMAPLSGAVLDHIGPVKPILAGVIVAFAGVLLLSLLGTGTGIVVPCVFFAVYSIGFSIAFSNIMTDGLNEIPPQLKADGNALFSTLQQLAGAAGTSVMSVLVSVAQAGHGKVGSAEYAQATVDGSRYGFICATVVVAVSACAILRAFTYRRRHIARAAK
jgi:nitrate/nitrite transporter NarK